MGSVVSRGCPLEEARCRRTNRVTVLRVTVLRRQSLTGPVFDRRPTRRPPAAYAPYSSLTVGAAGLCEDGAVITGCNVENASYGLTLCAECGLVSALFAGGHGRLLAVCVTAGDGRPLTPCGRCRQLLMEHGGPELLLDAGPAAPPQRLGQLLPGAFDKTELVERPTTVPSNGTGTPEAGS